MQVGNRLASMARILIVDDCAADRFLLRSVLGQRPQWQIEEVTDGVEAIEYIAERRPDVVLTDLQMPRLSGLELVARLREEMPGLPVVLITARGSEEIAARALRAGAAAYVPKRLLHVDLLETVDRVLDLALEQRNYYALLSRLEQVRWRVRLPNDLTMIRSLVSFVRRQLHEMRFGDDTEQFQVAIALEEALSNAYYHGNLELDSGMRECDIDSFYQLAERRRQEPPYARRGIIVVGNLSPHRIRFLVRDEGPGFDPSNLPDPTDPQNLEKASGRGILLMKSFMDEVTFLGRGNAVRMSRRVNKPRDNSPPGQAQYG